MTENTEKATQANITPRSGRSLRLRPRHWIDGACSCVGGLGGRPFSVSVEPAAAVAWSSKGMLSVWIGGEADMTFEKKNGLMEASGGLRLAGLAYLSNSSRLCASYTFSYIYAFSPFVRQSPNVDLWMYMVTLLRIHNAAL